MTFLDGMKEGKPVESFEINWFRKDYNALVGNVNDVYNDTGFASAYSAGPAAIGTVLVIRPATDSLQNLKNVQVDMQVIFRSASTFTRAVGVVTAVAYEGTYPSFTVRMLKADTGRAMEGTGITWTLAQRSHGENYEIGDAISEQEGDTKNYLYTDTEPFALTLRAHREGSRIVEDRKKTLEMEALDRINWRREITALEGIRDQRGDKYYAGGLRYFLEQYHPGNIIDWRTDTAFSAASDTPRLGTLPFFQRVTQSLRKFTKPGAKRVIELGSYGWGVINESAKANGNYNIDEKTNRFGMRVKYLQGVDEEWEIWLNNQLDHSDFKYTAYLMVPSYFQRHQPKDVNSKASKGLTYVKWSDPKNQDGENYTSRMKGSWIAEETYSFRQLACHAVIDNIGFDKA